MEIDITYLQRARALRQPKPTSKQIQNEKKVSFSEGPEVELEQVQTVEPIFVRNVRAGLPADKKTANPETGRLLKRLQPTVVQGADIKSVYQLESRQFQHRIDQLQCIQELIQLADGRYRDQLFKIRERLQHLTSQKIQTEFDVRLYQQRLRQFYFLQLRRGARLSGFRLKLLQQFRAQKQLDGVQTAFKHWNLAMRCADRSKWLCKQRRNRLLRSAFAAMWNCLEVVKINTQLADAFHERRAEATIAELFELMRVSGVESTACRQIGELRYLNRCFQTLKAHAIRKLVQKVRLTGEDPERLFLNTVDCTRAALLGQVYRAYVEKKERSRKLISSLNWQEAPPTQKKAPTKKRAAVPKSPALCSPMQEELPAALFGLQAASIKQLLQEPTPQVLSKTGLFKAPQIPLVQNGERFVVQQPGQRSSAQKFFAARLRLQSLRSASKQSIDVISCLSDSAVYSFKQLPEISRKALQRQSVEVNISVQAALFCQAKAFLAVRLAAAEEIFFGLGLDRWKLLRTGLVLGRWRTVIIEERATELSKADRQRAKHLCTAAFHSICEAYAQAGLAPEEELRAKNAFTLIKGRRIIAEWRAVVERQKQKCLVLEALVGVLQIIIRTKPAFAAWAVLAQRKKQLRTARQAVQGSRETQVLGDVFSRWTRAASDRALFRRVLGSALDRYAKVLNRSSVLQNRPLAARIFISQLRQEVRGDFGLKNADRLYDESLVSRSLRALLTSSKLELAARQFWASHGGLRLQRESLVATICFWQQLDEKHRVVSRETLQVAGKRWLWDSVLIAKCRQAVVYPKLKRKAISGLRQFYGLCTSARAYGSRRTQHEALGCIQRVLLESRIRHVMAQRFDHVLLRKVFNALRLAAHLRQQSLEEMLQQLSQVADAHFLGRLRLWAAGQCVLLTGQRLESSEAYYEQFGPLLDVEILKKLRRLFVLSVTQKAFQAWRLRAVLVGGGKQ